MMLTEKEASQLRESCPKGAATTGTGSLSSEILGYVRRTKKMRGNAGNHREYGAQRRSYFSKRSDSEAGK
jgi:hypothetical protein